MSTVEGLLPPCPECASEFTYEIGALVACPLCAHQWAPAATNQRRDGEDSASEAAIRDAFGNVLADGDTVPLGKSVQLPDGGGPTPKGGRKVTRNRQTRGT